MKRILITGHEAKRGSAEAAERAEKFLRDKAEVVGVCMGRNPVLPEGPLDLVLNLGGDGTLLNIIRRMSFRNVAVMGINFGRMGFLSAGLAEDLPALMGEFLEGKSKVQSRMLLSIRFPNKNGDMVEETALNDAVVCASDMGRVLELDANISDEFLFHLRGDGMIVSTPTGSTAHSLSAGGSIVDPDIDAILMTPLNPQSLSSRPIIVDPAEKIVLKLRSNADKVKLIADGRTLVDLNENQTICIERSSTRVSLVLPGDYNYYQRLGDKLGWNRLELSGEH